MSNENLQLEKPDAQRSSAHGDLGRLHVIYLLATGLATIGWFWFIGWCALKLV